MKSFINLPKEILKTAGHIRIVRFFVAGAIGFLVDIFSLYFLTDVVGLWYIASATLAFLIAFAVSFSLHKFWTFTDHSTDRIKNQAIIYLGVTIVNLWLNNMVLYAAVEYVGLHYLAGQMVASLVVATWSFFIYRWLFRPILPADAGVVHKHILIIINNLGIGGAERLVVGQIKEMVRLGHRVSLVTLAPEPQKTFADELPAVSDKFHSHCVHFRGLYDVFGWLGLVGYMARIKPDIVLTQLWFANTVGRVAAKVAGVKKVISFEQNVYDSVKTKKMFVVDRILQLFSTKIVAVSEAVKKSLVRHGISERKIAVIYNSVDTKSFSSTYDCVATRRSLGVRENAFLFTFIGRLIHQKAVDILIDAFAKMGDNPELLIVGQGTDQAALESLVKERQLQGRIMFAGVRSDVAAILSASDCFVLPSRYEGLPLVLTEAVAAGSAVIVSDFEAAGEVIEKEKSGLIVPRDNAQALAQAMDRVKKDTALRTRLSEAAKKSASRFSISNHVDAILRIE